eukprot:Clim_evm2s26 gene=Clim_evmTU2s26
MPAGLQQRKPASASSPDWSFAAQKAANHGNENARSHPGEFGGPFATLVMTCLLPFVVLGLFTSCTDGFCFGNLTSSEELATVKYRLTSYLWERVTNIDPTATVVVGAWIALHFVLYVVVPGPEKEGLPLRDGSGRLSYRLNGLRCGVISILILAAGHYTGIWNLAWLYERYFDCAVAAWLWSMLLAIFVYIRSFRPNALLALGGNSGCPPYDFFIGRELNPRISNFLGTGHDLDLKYVCELRPGLVGWVVLDVACMVARWQKDGTVPLTAVLVSAFHSWYVFDALVSEASVLSTMDITTDGFGFMLSFGDLTWVPFTYSLSARYLSEFTVASSTSSFDFASIIFTSPELLMALLLHGVGYYIFRASNAQKNLFRTNPKDPAVAHLQTMPTKRGTKLLVSGWWGTARHINYLGDWIMSLGWTAACGITHLIPWWYPIYFAILLLHRERRDDQLCEEKYGKDWDTYRRRVPSRIIPGIY